MIYVACLLPAFLALASRAWVEVALCLLGHLVVGLALELHDVAPVKSMSGTLAEIGIAGIRISCPP
jgi:hypothetical protein